MESLDGCLYIGKCGVFAVFSILGLTTTFHPDTQQLHTFFVVICPLMQMLMNRCDNCGWYNNDGATTCEKCGEPLSISAPIAPDVQPVSEPQAATVPPMAGKGTKLSFSKTVRMDEPVAAVASVPHPIPEPEPPKPNYRATVMDVSDSVPTAEEEVPKNCPKCHYPLAGDDVTCPNCGAQLRIRTRKDAVSLAETSPASVTSLNATVRDFGGAVAPAPVASRGGSKATIRETPKNLEEEAAALFHLVPIDGSPAIALKEGCIVVIGRRQYRFVK